MRGMDARTRPGVEAYYRDLEQKVARLGLTAAVRWCDWLPAHEMPQLYSLADVTLCLGDIVEASSNTALESLACQVPVIATDIACYRELPQAVIRVPPRDVPAAFWAVERLLDGAALQAPVAGRLEEKWDAALMVGTFCTLVEQAAIRVPLEVRLPDSQQTVRIPAWISDQGGRLYNEYSREFCDSAQLMTCWQLHNRQPFNFSLSDTDEVFAAEMQARGFFTPAAVQ